MLIHPNGILGVKTRAYECDTNVLCLQLYRHSQGTQLCECLRHVDTIGHFLAGDHTKYLADRREIHDGPGLTETDAQMIAEREETTTRTSKAETSLWGMRQEAAPFGKAWFT